jgi:hypothetical protein
MNHDHRIKKCMQEEPDGAEERKALQGRVESGFLAPDQLAPLTRRMEALETSVKTP